MFTGAIAEVFYNVPKDLEKAVLKRLPDEMKEIIKDFTFIKNIAQQK